ncbi:Tricyclene synthase [Forsythia ovata]|uniref:Tricyclene synthase n=1 Tax=Forsythia ovata TaxID=205694 RepID=A0ABD1WDV4_9LAMI
MAHSLQLLPLASSFIQDLPKHNLRESICNIERCQIHCIANKKTDYSITKRVSGYYKPSSWSHEFMMSMGDDRGVEVPKESSIKKLEETVKYMLDDGGTEPLDILQLIDDIQHLGLGYRFRESTKCALNKIKCSEKVKEKMHNSIRTCSLYFTLLRQHGYEVSADIFENFKDHNGNFKESLSQDVVGMLSLYEASHFAYNGEKILDEARKFTSMKLKEMLGKIDMKIGEKVKHALEIPFQWRMQRLEARWNIEEYNKKDGANQFLLKLAILDFNMVQSMLQKDLQQHLPDYMKICFLALYNTVNNMAYDVLKEQGHVILPQLTKVWADLCKLFLKEAKWSYNKQIPKFEEYMSNGWISSSGPLLLVHAYFLMSQNITNEALQSFNTYPSLLRFPSTIFRLSNDLSSSKAEIERGETANAISCYMHENGVSEKVAREYLTSLIDENWKMMNKELVSNSLFDKSFIEIAINLARIAQCHYQYGNAHSDPNDVTRNRVLWVIIDPIQLKIQQPICRN